MAPLGTPLEGLSIVIAGTFPGTNHGNITKIITKLGGKVTKDVVDDTTHVITISGVKNGKITAARANSAISIVTLDWLERCDGTNKLVKTDSFLIKFDDDATTQSTSTNNTTTDGASAPRRSGRAAASASQNSQQDAAPAAPAKRSRSVKKEKTPEPEEEEAPKKRGRVTKAAKADEDVAMADADDTKPAAKGKKGAVKKDVAVQDDAKPASKKAAGRGKKVKKEATPADDEESEEEVVAPKMKTVTAIKGTAPVDEYCPVKDIYHVYTDSNGQVYDGALNQTQINANANKFYYVQLLRNTSNPNQYATWTRWGRVGEKGQFKMVAGPGVDFYTAQREFHSKFKSKSGLNWEDRFSEPKNGKYTFIEKSYEEDSDDEDTKAKSGSSEPAKEVVKVESRLPESLQRLMQLIFNVGYMNESMVEMNYDANKLPLGKLSKETLKRGYEVLKQIGDLLNSPTNNGQTYEQLSNRYYSIIPHVTGRVAPPKINSPERLKKEADLLDALGDMGIANQIIKETAGPTDEDGNPINQLDARFRSLNLECAEPLHPSSREYQLLAAYVAKTHGATHHMHLQIEDIFRITRPGEDDRWKSAGWDTYANSERRLLWHGSRTTNFGGILSQGLRIAPPEAPVNGYMFGKGIYLADMVSKSANYCCAHSSGNTGLLLLCDAQVGNPMFELQYSDYQAGEKCHEAKKIATHGMGRTVPKGWMKADELGDWAKGVLMPDVDAVGMDATTSSSKAGSLYYNEYIVYDVSQVQVRYLFRCKFISKY